MDALTEGLVASDEDTIEMTAIMTEDIIDQDQDDSDEVEQLRNSLREAVQDDAIRPKMQCLMMDSSFSMVTMQGEDCGIAWETTPSRCTTPWASEAGHPSDLSPPVGLQAVTSGSAGKISFVMDEELFSRWKKVKEMKKSQKSKADRHREVFEQSSEDGSGRPELVGVSRPNVKPEEGDEEEPNDPPINKEQSLFSLVSEGSEILNIVVPPRLYTVDEEQSKEMVDNLFYLEEIPVSKASKETNDGESVVSNTGSGAAGADQAKRSPSNAMDPPGAPVARPLGSRAVCNVDYFEAYNLVDAQAPGSPAVVAPRRAEQEVRVYTDSQDTKTPVQAKDNVTTATTSLDRDDSDAILLGEIACELLDDVFYGGTENYKKTTDGASEATPSRAPSKPSGSTLFGSQEDILTPIFLPEGPPKIIDPILLEEPKAMAFLYTDLYEEAVGSRKKEEDVESITSEKSFHSRNSDREARGYLEKYVLLDETPVVEEEHADNQGCPEETPRVLSRDLYEVGDFLSGPEKNEMSSSEEEITDFFRSSANSSPCDKKYFVQSLDEDEDKATKKTTDMSNKSVFNKVEKAAEIPADPLSISSFEFPSEETDWGSADDYNLDDNYEHLDFWKGDAEVQKPIAPPRKRARSSSNARLDLTPLIPIESEEKDGVGGNEHKKSGFAAVESAQDESVKDGNEIIAKPTAAEAKDARTVETSAAEAAAELTESDAVDIKSSESAKTESYPEEQRDRLTASSAEPAKDKGQCVIL